MTTPQDERRPDGVATRGRLAPEYDPGAIEAKWQARWAADALFRAPRIPSRRKFYALEMFAYPSGDLHMGHFRNYTLGDAVARVKLMQGCDVLHPFGWDAFGLPAENAAISRRLHPAEWTWNNINVSRATLQKTGVGYDWSRELATCTPEYYRWNQWFFLLLWRRGLAYRGTASVNWCPGCNTVLANEQVKDGACERCDSTVEKRELTQWFFRITAYADRLVDDLATLPDWPEPIKAMQTHWIGRSEGADLDFAIDGPVEGAGSDSSPAKLTVFTTRPDTVFGATFMAIAPEHPRVAELVRGRAEEAPVAEFKAQAMKRSDIERTGPEAKAGLFIGRYAVNPVSGERVPIWIAEYVLPGYGTGAIMGVPAHDERDFEFARLHDIEIREVIRPAGTNAEVSSARGESRAAAYCGEGIMVNSGEFTGKPSGEGGRAVTAWAESHGVGRPRVNYRLRDWLVSRQRYWGTPIPMVHCPTDGVVPVPEQDLPVMLPREGIDYLPKGRSPLADSAEFMNVTCPTCGGPAQRDADTMDTFVDSSWYYLRYLDPKNEAGPFDREEAAAWLPVDQYIGGATHATGHLIFFRFFHKVLFDEGWVKEAEPATRLFNHGMVLDADGRVMSKSLGNVTSPVHLMEKHGGDALRIAMFFAAPPEREVLWTGHHLAGAARFLQRVYRLVRDNEDALRAHAGGAATVSPDAISAEEAQLYRGLHRTLMRTARDLDSFKQNTAIAALMEYLNDLSAWKNRGNPVFLHAVHEFIRALAPLAPHLGEELWEAAGHSTSVFRSGWIEWDSDAARGDVVSVVVQVDGKLRAQLELPRGADAASAEAAARSDEKIQRSLEGRELLRVVHVPDRLVNFVLKKLAA